MKTLKCICTIVAFFITIMPALSQTTYQYPLKSDFKSVQPGGPDLVQIENNDGLTGEFTSRTVPVTTCTQGGLAGGYFFEDDAGLQFNSPAGFVDESYSLSLIFQIDELISPPPWVRILSFTHTDDHGIYIYLTNPPFTGTLDFWPNGTVGEQDFFDTENFYQLILVRNDASLIKIYINGSEFSEYDDSGTQEYKFHDPDNYLIFFRDHPSVLADEASPGFVSHIKITNQAWNLEQVSKEWEDFCSSLLGTQENEIKKITVYPNPVKDELTIEIPGNNESSEISVLDITGKVVKEMSMSNSRMNIDVSGFQKGFYFIRILRGTDSRVMKFMKN